MNNINATERTPLCLKSQESTFQDKTTNQYNETKQFEIESLLSEEPEKEKVTNSASFSLAHLNLKNGLPYQIYFIASLAFFFSIIFLIIGINKFQNLNERNIPTVSSAWNSKAEPFSQTNPVDIGIQNVLRPSFSTPGIVFKEMVEKNHALPTNSWFENFLLGVFNNLPENNVFQVPYILDLAGPIVGIRSHPCHLEANSKAVMMTYELSNGLTVGAMEPFSSQHLVHTEEEPIITKLAIELEWMQDITQKEIPTSLMRSLVVRGSPYTSMLYINATPRIYAERPIKSKIEVDQGRDFLECGLKAGDFSSRPVIVNNEMKLTFDSSDMTWIVFVSQPMEFICTNYDASDDIRNENLPPGVISTKKSYFDLRALHPMSKGMVRVAMTNNCTTGQNPQYCSLSQPKNMSEYESLIRKHSDIYPTVKADIEFSFPIQSAEEEELRLIFHWRPARMSQISASTDPDSLYKDPSFDLNPHDEIPPLEVLMFALPHHQERMRPTPWSSNKVLRVGCTSTLQGLACPAIGNSWSLIEHLHRTSFSATLIPREEMLSDLKQAIIKDLGWRIPENYMKGAGDTYFSGKMLAKLARVLLIADELGFAKSKVFTQALAHLTSGVEVWFNGSAQSPLLYDHSWKGLVMCGCDYDGSTASCRNVFPNCPALTDMGQNFGAGFYNDHHYHFGYHIYAAAVVSKFNSLWAKKWHQHVLLYVRDIANPSEDDSYFPTWRHKDWYVGFSWASGVVTIRDRPYPNGRNQESVSEAISAYEAVAMYGDVMSSIFSREPIGPANEILYNNALRVRDMGRLLMATEIRSAKTYWHVQQPGTPGVSRIYPDVYQPRIVGMIWSMLAQEQTWFGNEEWKSYGIQFIPYTPAAELRDEPSWVKEMLPFFEASCAKDPVCEREGWSIAVLLSKATSGDWENAWKGLKEVFHKFPNVFESAGGNGHSLTNCLWYISTRPTLIE